MLVRSAFLVMSFYAAGHPHFDGARPAVLDKPFIAFHADINSMARDGIRTVSLIEATYSFRFLSGLRAQLAPHPTER